MNTCITLFLDLFLVCGMFEPFEVKAFVVCGLFLHLRSNLAWKRWSLCSQGSISFILEEFYRVQVLFEWGVEVANNLVNFLKRERLQRIILCQLVSKSVSLVRVKFEVCIYAKLLDLR